MSFTGLRQPISQVMRVKFTIPANSPAGTSVIGEITTDPSLQPTQVITVPANEVWHIVDVYAESTADVGVDGYVDLYINELRQNLRFGPLRQTLKSLLNPIRLRQAVVIDRLSRFQFVFTTRSATGASATTTEITVEVVRVPVSPVR
jgi:hypothetical protein